MECEVVGSNPSDPLTLTLTFLEPVPAVFLHTGGGGGMTAHRACEGGGGACITGIYMQSSFAPAKIEGKNISLSKFQKCMSKVNTDLKVRVGLRSGS